MESNYTPKEVKIENKIPVCEFWFGPVWLKNELQVSRAPVHPTNFAIQTEQKVQFGSSISIFYEMWQVCEKKSISWPEVGTGGLGSGM